MAAGPSAIGLAAFAAIKLAGYTAAGAYVNRRAAKHAPKPIVFGAVRTIVGLVAGIGAVFVLESLSIPRGEVVFFAALLPIRMAEWLLVFWMFHRETELWRKHRALAAFLATLWSFVLDVPAIAAAFVVPGGMWIC